MDYNTYRKGVFCAIAFFFVWVLASVARSEPVSVNRGTGLGFVFNQNGNCYVVLPEHVHGARLRLSLLTAAPSAVGDAEIFKTFLPTDLSIGLVRSGLESRCEQSWEDLPDRTDALLDSSVRAVLIRVLPSGLEDDVPMIIRSRDLDLLTAVPDDSGRAAEIYKGTSGGLLKIGDKIIGMAIKSANPEEATFLRIDKIKIELSRLLEARAEAAPQAGGDQMQASNPSGCAAGAVPVHSVVCDREPLSPDRSCSNLASDGKGAMVMPTGKIEVIAELAEDKPTPITEINLSKDPSDATTASPKSLQIEIDSSDSTSRRWRDFGSGDMTPFGSARIVNGARPYARRIRITIWSSWDGALPTRLDCLSAN